MGTDTLAEIARELRKEFNLEGWRGPDIDSFRDKIRMKELINQAGLRAPRYLALPQDTRQWPSWPQIEREIR